MEFAPVVSVSRPRLGQALQFDMDLECHVEAYPPPAITWEKDDITLSNNQHYKISHFAVADEITDTTLRVITIEKRQYGQYVCKAANKLGTAEGTVELFGTFACSYKRLPLPLILISFRARTKVFWDRPTGFGPSNRIFFRDTFVRLSVCIFPDAFCLCSIAIASYCLCL